MFLKWLFVVLFAVAGLGCAGGNRFAVEISAGDGLEGGMSRVIRVYDIRAILADDRIFARLLTDCDRARELIVAIQDTIAADTWAENGGSVGKIHMFNGKLIITQTRDIMLRLRHLSKRFSSCGSR